MPEAAALKPLPFPVKHVSATESQDNGEISWWQKVQLIFGVRSIDMANHPNTPPSMPLNVTTIGTWVVIIVAILGGFWWAYQLGQTNGKDQKTIEQLNERLTKAEQDAAEAKKLQTYSAGVADTHSAEKKEPKK